MNKFNRENTACGMVILSRRRRSKQEVENLKQIWDYETREGLTEKAAGSYHPEEAKGLTVLSDWF